MIIIQPVQIGGGYDSGYTYGYNSGYTDGYLSGYSYDPISGWVRNPEWLPIPSISDSEQVIYILVRVDSGDTKYNIHKFGISMSSSPSITIDWGDGTIETKTNVGQTYYSHQYDFNNPNISGLTSEGYKQALIKITRNSGIIAYYYLNSKPATNVSVSKALDIVARMNATSMNNTLAASDVAGNYNLFYLERVLFLYPYANIPAIGTFLSGVALRKVALNITNPTNIYTMFYNCLNLTNVDDVNITFTTNTLYDCQNLFGLARSIKKLPSWFYNIKPTNLNNTFYECNALEEVGDLDTSNCTGFGTTFYNATALRKIGAYDYSKSQYFHRTFMGAIALRQFGNKDGILDITFANAHGNNSMENMFLTAYQIKEINITILPSFSLTTNATPGINFFSGCSSLRKIRVNGVERQTISNKFTRLDSYFNGCGRLENVYLDCSGATNISSMFGNNQNLKTCRLLNLNSGMTGLSTALNFTSSSLDRTALIALFNDLPVVSGTYTITITNSLGAPDLTAADRLIATNKGWTITG